MTIPPQLLTPSRPTADTIPNDRIQALQQIGLAVVESLITEGLAADAGGSTWKAWAVRKTTNLGLGKWVAPTKGDGDKRAELAREMSLGTRLKVDPWGMLMLSDGQKHFKDEIHPSALPGSWLYGNMLLEQLHRRVVDGGGSA